MKKHPVVVAALFNTQRAMAVLVLFCACAFNAHSAERMVLAEDFTFQQ
ncbi:MAG: hypothetical protein ABIG44_11295 [Planctomycetota bacterium]